MALSGSDNLFLQLHVIWSIYL